MIPVYQPMIGSREAKNVLEAMREGMISGTAGKFIPEFEQRFADYCGCKYGVAVNSGTAALHLAAIAAGIGPGDEVLVSACTNIASANAVAQLGGVVVPIDSESDTWNMDVALLERAITPRTKAIMPVHIYGHPVDMGSLLKLAKDRGLYVIEDCAEAHGATYWGERVGGLGDVGCFSFYANKVITTGEGGMLVTNDFQTAEHARKLRNLSFGEPRFVHEEMGFNYRMTNLQAAIGCAQLDRIDTVIEVKREIARLYNDRLSLIGGLRLPVEREYAKNVYWMYALVVDSDFGMGRDRLMAELKEYGVETRTMFCPMNLQPSLLKARAVRPTACPVAEDLWENGLYLPSGCDLSEHTIDQICKVIDEVHACV